MGKSNAVQPRSAGRPIPRLRSTQPAADPESFFNAVKQALDLFLTSNQTPSGSIPFYLHQFPQERVTLVDQPFDGITFKVISSVPAEVRTDGTISRKPYQFEEDDPTQTGYVIKTDSWFELLTVEFTIWSKSNPTRGSLVNWFHRFILRHANRYRFFEARGVDKFQFVGRGEDGFETHEEQEIYYGTLTYQARVQFIDTFSERKIDQLSVSLQLGQDQQTILQTA